MSNPSEFLFLRHGKLSLPYKDHSEMPFEVLRQLGLGMMNPPIDIPYTSSRVSDLHEELSTIEHMYVSPSPRCQETARLIQSLLGKDVPMTTLPELIEVHFDLQLLNETHHFQNGDVEVDIAAVNTAVFKGMLEARGAEALETVYKRVVSIFKAHPLFQGKTLYLTHDFLMRILEIFITRHGSSFRAISLQELEKTQRNGYVKGFRTNGSFAELTYL